MSVTINGVRFLDRPTFCGDCQAAIHDNGKLAWCTWFDLNKHKYDPVPKRCDTIFNKAFAAGPGSYVITMK